MKIVKSLALLTSATLSLGVASQTLAGGKSLGKASGVVPATVSEIPGSELHQVTLTERAMQRIDLKTTRVTEEMVKGLPRKVVPYSSIIYDPSGGTWVYTSPKARNFVRAAIDVDFVDGDRVVLRSGPAVGTVVASVGVAELYGTEFEVGH